MPGPSNVSSLLRFLYALPSQYPVSPSELIDLSNLYPSVPPMIPITNSRFCFAGRIMLKGRHNDTAPNVAALLIKETTLPDFKVDQRPQSLGMVFARRVT